MNLQAVKDYILSKLENELNPKLTYHGVHHTLDVFNSVTRIAESENVSKNNMALLQTAALFHDSGFVKVYKGHEEQGCILASEILPEHGYSIEDITSINSIIMATQIPQSPVNALSEMLCDADLDYLGRNDFKPIADSLFKEMVAFKFIENEQQWNRIQLNFLGNHHYFRQYCRVNREPKKQVHLDVIREIVATYND